MLTHCPRELPAEVWTVIRSADWADKAILPVAGGMLDQTDAWVGAVELVRRENADWESRLRSR